MDYFGQSSRMSMLVQQTEMAQQLLDELPWSGVQLYPQTTSAVEICGLKWNVHY